MASLNDYVLNSFKSMNQLASLLTEAKAAALVSLTAHNNNTEAIERDKAYMRRPESVILMKQKRAKTDGSAATKVFGIEELVAEIISHIREPYTIASLCMVAKSVNLASLDKLPTTRDNVGKSGSRYSETIQHIAKYETNVMEPMSKLSAVNNIGDFVFLAYKWYYVHIQGPGYLSVDVDKTRIAKWIMNNNRYIDNKVWSEIKVKSPQPGEPKYLYYTPSSSKKISEQELFRLRNRVCDMEQRAANGRIGDQLVEPVSMLDRAFVNVRNIGKSDGMPQFVIKLAEALRLAAIDINASMRISEMVGFYSRYSLRLRLATTVDKFQTNKQTLVHKPTADIARKL